MRRTFDHESPALVAPESSLLQTARVLGIYVGED